MSYWRPYVQQSFITFTTAVLYLCSFCLFFYFSLYVYIGVLSSEKNFFSDVLFQCFVATLFHSLQNLLLCVFLWVEIIRKRCQKHVIVRPQRKKGRAQVYGFIYGIGSSLNWRRMMMFKYVVLNTQKNVQKSILYTNFPSLSINLIINNTRTRYRSNFYY